VLGGSWPAQIWQLYTTAALADTPVSEFPVPPPLVFGADAPDVAVPDVVGMPVEPAEAALGREGFRVVRQERSSTQYPPGYVVAQTPTAGASAKGGSEVTLFVSTGPPATTVPDVLDLAEAEAREKVADAGLKVKVVEQQEPKSPGSGSRKGKVWKQSPAGGSPADRGDTVTVYVNPG
jgi:serine/threonine-protein kinase